MRPFRSNERLAFAATACDLSKLQSHPALLDEIQSWTEHCLALRGYYKYYSIRRQRRNADGLLLWSSKEREKEDEVAGDFVQFYENGIVEAADHQIMDQVLHSKIIPGTAVERAIVTLVPAVLEAQRLLGLDGKVWIAISIVDSLEYVTLSYDEQVSRGPGYIGRKHRLLLPPVTTDLEDNRAIIMRQLSSVFDSLAHAGGWDRSPNAYH